MRINRYFIPNFISACSILSGFLAIIMAGYNEHKVSALMIILGAFFDGIDGKVARALKATNDMGKEMDSLADLITFGLAPGYLIFQTNLYKYGNWGILLSAVIPICAAIRLARFNIMPTKTYFQGVPSTWAGLSIAFLIGFCSQMLPNYFYLVYALAISLLMVSTFHYYKPDRKALKINSTRLVMALIFILAAVYNYKMTIISVIIIYDISGIIYSSFLFLNNKKYRPYKIKL